MSKVTSDTPTETPRPPVDLAPLLALPPEIADELNKATSALDELETSGVFDKMRSVLDAVEAHYSETVKRLEAMQLPEQTLWNVREALPYINAGSDLSDRIFRLHEHLGVICGSTGIGASTTERQPGHVYTDEGALIGIHPTVAPHLIAAQAAIAELEAD